MTRREGDATEGVWGREGGRHRVGGVCRSSVSVLLPFASCPLKWCKIYEARPPFCNHFIEFYFLRQKWSAESRHCCCCYCEWCCCCCCCCGWCCCCALCCCCCSSSCFVIYCLQLPNLFLFFCCKFTILFCGLFDAAGIPLPFYPTPAPHPPATPSIHGIAKPFFFSCFPSFFSVLCVLRFGLQLFSNCFYNTKKAQEETPEIKLCKFHMCVCKCVWLKVRMPKVGNNKIEAKSCSRSVQHRTALKRASAKGFHLRRGKKTIEDILNRELQ